MIPTRPRTLLAPLGRMVRVAGQSSLGWLLLLVACGDTGGPGGTAILTGKVSSSSLGFGPLANAVVTATRGGSTRTATTDAQGNYRIEGLPAGSVTVTVAGTGASCFVLSALNVSLSAEATTTADLSPVCHRIAFVAQQQFGCRIIVMHADGTARLELPASVRCDSDVSWSPDGGHLVHNSSNFTGIRILDLGSGTTCTLTTGLNDYRAQWSPDGRRIAYISAGGAISLVNPDGTGAAALTPSISGDRPSWAPDGNGLIYGSGRNDRGEIYATGIPPGRPTARGSPLRPGGIRNGRSS